MGIAIVFPSGKGGVGKSAASINIGAALAKAGKKVALVDTDIGLRKLDMLLGLETRVVYDIMDVAEGRCKLRQALIKDNRFEELQLLAASHYKEHTSLRPEQMMAIADELKAEFDFVILDCPSGIEDGFETAVAGADEAIVVTTTDRSAVRNADRVIGLLERRSFRNVSMLINNYDEKLARSGDTTDIADIEAVIGARIIGVVPNDPTVIKASNKGKPVILFPASKAAQAYQHIANKIMGVDAKPKTGSRG